MVASAWPDFAMMWPFMLASFFAGGAFGVAVVTFQEWLAGKTHGQ